MKFIRQQFFWVYRNYPKFCSFVLWTIVLTIQQYSYLLEIFIYLSYLNVLFLSSPATSLKTEYAPSGGNVTIHCLHILAYDNIKYFCREKCDGRNTLIISDRGRNPTHRDRYSLYDEGSNFRVTITDLSSSDSGSYICAVQRLLMDTYGYVKLHVTEGNLFI